jgi:hypothetical protein
VFNVKNRRSCSVPAQHRRGGNPRRLRLVGDGPVGANAMLSENAADRWLDVREMIGFDAKRRTARHKVAYGQSPKAYRVTMLDGVARGGFTLFPILLGSEALTLNADRSKLVDQCLVHAERSRRLLTSVWSLDFEVRLVSMRRGPGLGD